MGGIGGAWAAVYMERKGVYLVWEPAGPGPPGLGWVVAFRGA